MSAGPGTPPWYADAADARARRDRYTVAMPPSVVITGLGVVSPFGIGIEPLWEAFCAGRSGLRPIQVFDPTGFRAQLAGEVPELKARDHVPKSYRKAVKVMARDIELAVVAALAAVRDAGIVTRGTDPEATPTYPGPRVGCHIGAGLIASDVDELATALVRAAADDGFSYEAWGNEGMQHLPPLWMLKYLPNMLACHVTIIHGAESASNTITCAEASGPLSVAESARVIERGGADLCFSGGAESPITPFAMLRCEMAGWLAHAPADADPATIVRPYDPDSAGGLVGEAGAILIVENEETARGRGVEVLCTIRGFGATQSPRRERGLGLADGLEHAIRIALRDADLPADAIDAIVPRALGSADVDAAEAEALGRVFGDRLAGVPLLTMTPAVGNCGAGLGALGLCVGAQTLRTQRLPARIHTGTPAAGLDAGPSPARDATLDAVLVCTGSLGGQNAAVVLTR